MKLIDNLTFAGALALGLSAAVANPPPGTLDESFDAKLTEVGGPPTWPGIVDMALAPDGKIYLGGHGFSIEGVPQRGLARLHPDGSVDSSFRVQPREDIGMDAHQILLQPDGKVWAGHLNLYRYLATGEFDATINSRLGGWNLLGIQADGKLLAGDGQLRRYTTEGELDIAFNAPADHVRNDSMLVIQADGKIIVLADTRILRLNSDGSLDLSIEKSAMNGDIGELAVHPQSGKIYCHGDFTQINGIPRNGVARLNADCSLDLSFVPPMDLAWETVGSRPRLAVQPDGKLIIGHNFYTPDVFGVGARPVGGRLVRLNLDGSLDAILPFDPGHSPVAGPVYRVLVQPDGKILVCGDFTIVNGVPRAGVVRLHGGNEVPALSLGEVRRAGDGGIEFQITGPTNQKIVIEATNNLLPPQWASIATNQLDHGAVTFHEPKAAGGLPRFYRACFWP